MVGSNAYSRWISKDIHLFLRLSASYFVTFFKTYDKRKDFSVLEKSGGILLNSICNRRMNI